MRHLRSDTIAFKITSPKYFRSNHCDRIESLALSPSVSVSFICHCNMPIHLHTSKLQYAFMNHLHNRHVFDFTYIVHIVYLYLFECLHAKNVSDQVSSVIYVVIHTTCTTVYIYYACHAHICAKIMCIHFATSCLNRIPTPFGLAAVRLIPYNRTNPYTIHTHKHQAIVVCVYLHTPTYSHIHLCIIWCMRAVCMHTHVCWLVARAWHAVG